MENFRDAELKKWLAEEYEKETEENGCSRRLYLGMEKGVCNFNAEIQDHRILRRNVLRYKCIGENITPAKP